MASKQPSLFAEMAARAVDLRGDDGAFNIAMKYAISTLKDLQDAGHYRGKEVVLILRAGARVLADYGQYAAECDKWTAAADELDSSSVLGTV